MPQGWIDRDTHYTEEELANVPVARYMAAYIWRCGVAILRVIDTKETHDDADALHELNIVQV